MSDDVPVWASADKCLRLITEIVGSRDEAIEIIMDGLRGGGVTARGEQGITARLLQGSAARHIPSEFWRRATAEDRASWSWSAGRFGIGGFDSYTEVEFDTLDVLALAGDHERPSLASPAAQPKEPAPRHSWQLDAEPKWDWGPILIELIASAALDDVTEDYDLQNLSRRGEQARLERWMMARFESATGQAPSEAEIRKRAAAIKVEIERLRARKSA